MIIFTRRELVNAWRGAQSASQIATRTNAHRLLLFYAAECGLKAVYLKRSNVDLLEGEIGGQLKHDLNKVMALLRIGKDLFLPTTLALNSVQKAGVAIDRRCSPDNLNQVWRYGGVLRAPDDVSVEEKLDEINAWIAKEI